MNKSIWLYNQPVWDIKEFCEHFSYELYINGSDLWLQKVRTSK